MDEAVELRWFRSHVERCLQEVWDVCTVERDDDGDYLFVHESAFGWVSVRDSSPPMVVVVAHAAYDVPGTAAVLREVNELAARTLTTTVVWDRKVVTVRQALVGDAVTPDSLGQAYEAVSSLAAHVGPLLVAVHGGRPAVASESVLDDD